MQGKSIVSSSFVTISEFITAVEQHGPEPQTAPVELLSGPTVQDTSTLLLLNVRRSLKTQTLSIHMRVLRTAAALFSSRTTTTP